MMVAFGTGVNVTDSDRSSTDVQSVYSILDNTRYKTLSAGGVKINTDTGDNGVIPSAISGTSQLVEQEMDGSAGGSTRFWKMKNHDVTFTGAGAKKG